MIKPKTTKGNLYHVEHDRLSNGKYELRLFVENTKGKHVTHKIIVDGYLSPSIVRAVTSETRRIANEAGVLLIETKNAVNP